jgi:glutaredoxin
MVPVAELTLLSKPGCHLCDDAREAVARVIAELAADPAAPELSLVEHSILNDPKLLDEYAEDIPVVLINGRVHTVWRVDPVRLRTALLELE